MAMTEIPWVSWWGMNKQRILFKDSSLFQLAAYDSSKWQFSPTVRFDHKQRVIWWPRIHNERTPQFEQNYMSFGSPVSSNYNSRWEFLSTMIKSTNITTTNCWYCLTAIVEYLEFFENKFWFFFFSWKMFFFFKITVLSSWHNWQTVFRALFRARRCILM